MAFAGADGGVVEGFEEYDAATPTRSGAVEARDFQKAACGDVLVGEKM